MGVDALGHGWHGQRLHERRVVEKIKRAVMAFHHVAAAAVRPGGVVDANLRIAEAPGQAERDIAVGRDAQPLHISGDGIHRRRMLPKSEGAVVVGRVGERERWVGLAGRAA